MKVSDVLAVGRHKNLQARSVPEGSVSLFDGTILFLETIVHFYTQYILYAEELTRGTGEAGATQALRNKISTYDAAFAFRATCSPTPASLAALGPG
jgi:hypothetical protein